jgi:steroid delta-isomerase-like uncharacterized protein
LEEKSQVGPEEDLELFRRYIDAMNSRDYDALTTILSRDHVWHGINSTSTGIDAFKEVIGGYVGALPDVRMDIEHVFAGNGFVGARVHHRGTNLGDWPPRAGAAPATGKAVDFPLHVHARVENGRIAEVWEQWNVLKLREQIGRA